MGEHISLRAADGQALGAYVAHPGSEPFAGLVVVQEIFGVNDAHPAGCRWLGQGRLPGGGAGAV